MVVTIRPPSSAGIGKIFITAKLTESNAVNIRIRDIGKPFSTNATNVPPTAIGPQRDFFAS